MSNKLIILDLFFVIEKLLPGKRTVALFRKNTKHLPVTTLTLSHCDSASALLLALFKYCMNYVAFSHGTPLSDDYSIDGKNNQLQLATQILAGFIRGSYWWVEHYLEIYREDWSKVQKEQWLKDLKLLVQAIIGIGNCRKAEWLIKNRSAIKVLTYSSHITPFLQHYD
ncbi:hypothetical protein [Candidatus Enterovibrio escicola]|uniref:Uncharacterized protein n=1 Tax=Candidatus Enterovibrio escicola TaxID=1927127 RepID=A0A2A5T7K7_9GAMM|nr:hypothetical protein [Candidatus Enterovibrio escacola]PCS24108.1 hypothetical protein BTN49_0102 [Candidatus Enterovibrio escacola]